MKDLLRDALGQVDTELRRDLWPQMREKIEARRPFPLFDWALAAGVIAWIIVYPQSLVALLYHL